jgi:hypothetical protein
VTVAHVIADLGVKPTDDGSQKQTQTPKQMFTAQKYQCKEDERGLVKLLVALEGRDDSRRLHAGCATAIHANVLCKTKPITQTSNAATTACMRRCSKNT